MPTRLPDDHLREETGDGRLLTVNDGKGTHAYAYDPTTGELTKLVDSAAVTLRWDTDHEVTSPVLSLNARERERWGGIYLNVLPAGSSMKAILIERDGPGRIFAERRLIKASGNNC